MKTKKHKKILIGLMIISLVAMYGVIPPTHEAKAVDAITDASQLLSDSDVSVIATSTFTFTTGTTTQTNGYWDLVFDSNFTGLATSTITCAYGAAGFTEQLIGSNRVRCLYTGAGQVGTTTQVVVGHTNPATANDYTTNIYHYASSTQSLAEQVQVKVQIIDDVWMTATVDSILEFTVSGTSTAGVVNGIPCSEASTATTTPFNTLVVDATSTVCQDLTVETNADDGYTVTVEQDQEMTSDSGSNINSFNNSTNGTGSTTAQAWASPNNTLDAYHTYGHMGLTSDDTDLNSLGGYNDFYNSGDAHFAGLNSTDPMPIMHHNGPSDGTTQDIGSASVLYQVEVASLQEAGDYESTLTYICTPIY